MLALCLRFQDELFFTLPDGTHMVLRVVATDERKVRVAVAAPEGVRILRGDLLGHGEKVERRKAAGVPDEYQS